MQKRHTDRKMYFRDLEITSKEFYISYLSDFTELNQRVESWRLAVAKEET